MRKTLSLSEVEREVGHPIQENMVIVFRGRKRNVLVVLRHIDRMVLEEI